jgi:phage shock protein C
MKSDNSINPHQLYRNSSEGIFSGVCAGIADYFDVPKLLVRFLAVAFFFFSAGLAIVFYIAASFLLKPAPAKVYGSTGEEKFWRGVSRSPYETLSSLKYQFMIIDEKLCKMEDQVTSREFELNNKFREL